MRFLGDGTLMPWGPMGIRGAGDDTLYVTIIALFTLLRLSPATLRMGAKDVK